MIELEDDLGAYLTNASRCRRSDLAELAAVCISIYRSRQEVSVIEHVEHFESHVKRRAFGKFCVLLQAQICVDGSRPAERILFCAASHATGLVTATEIGREC